MRILYFIVFIILILQSCKKEDDIDTFIIGDLYFLSQSDLDNYKSNDELFCKKAIIGNLSISGNTITNLTALQNLERITGELRIHYTKNLESLSGLENIKRIEDWFYINNNESLVSLSNLNSLDSVKGLYICSNYMLQEINIAELSYIEEGVEIGGNRSLIEIVKLFNNSIYRCDLDTYNNYELSSNEFLASLEYVNGSLRISNNNFRNLQGLRNLRCVHNIRIGTIGTAGDFNIQEISSLNNLESVTGNLLIMHCYNLKKINGFENLREIGGSLSIHGDTSLSVVDGFANLERIGQDLSISSHSEKLTVIDCFQNIHNIGGDLWVKESKLENLNYLDTIGEICSVNYTSFPALSSLQYIGNYIEARLPDTNYCQYIFPLEELIANGYIGFSAITAVPNYGERISVEQLKMCFEN